MQSRRIERFDPHFPSRLASLRAPPTAVWLRGELPREPGVAIVGTRRPTAAAEQFAFEIAATLANAGFAIWSGGAKGIDTAAHRGALRAGGATVVALGGGIRRPYPQENEALFADVVAARGALLALVDDETSPRRWVFLARNAVLAAMTQAIVLVECPLKSGARNAVAAARRLGRPVWVASQPPWAAAAPTVEVEQELGASVFFGTRTLVQKLCAQVGVAEPLRSQAAIKLEANETIEGRILRLLRERPAHLDELCERLGVAAAEVQYVLMLLRLEGKVTDGVGGRVAITTQ